MNGWKLTGIGCSMILLGMVALVLAVTTSHKNQFNAQIAAIRASGAPVSAADLMAEVIPDPMNGALVYLDIARRMEDPAVKPEIETITSVASSSEEKPDAAAWEEARRAMARHTDLLDLIEEASSKPRCRFPRDYSKGSEVLFPEFAKMRRMAQICLVSARLNARSGKMNEAFLSVELGYKVSEAMREDPTLIGYLVRISCLAIASAGLRDTLAHGDIDEEQARRIYDVLSDIDLDRGCVTAMQGERVVFLTVMRGSSGSGSLSAREFYSDMGGMPGEALGGVYDRLLLRGDIAAYLRFMDENIEYVGLNYQEAKARGILDDQVADLPSYAIISKIIAPIHGKSHSTRYTNQCRIAGDRILLAVLAFKDRYGKYPADLGELRDRLGWEIPEDPYSNKDFIYKREAKGFLLYSVGPNMVDDGGVQNMSYISHDETGDHVWKITR